MKKIWLVFKHEYVRRVKTKGFIFAVLSMPLLVILGSVMGLISVRMQTNFQPVGYLDLAGALKADFVEMNSSTFSLGTIDLLEYEDEDTGLNALEDDAIQALFIIQPDYLESGEVIVYAQERPVKMPLVR